MISTASLIIFLLFAGIVGYWYRYFLIKEQALNYCKRFCENKGLQLLDEHINLISSKFTREQGHICMYRIFEFDYCHTTQERKKGRIWTLGSQLGQITLKDNVTAVKASSSENKVIPFPKRSK